VSLVFRNNVLTQVLSHIPFGFPSQSASAVASCEWNFVVL